MSDDHFASALVVASVLGLASTAAIVTSRSGDVPLHLSPVPAVTVAIARPCVFLAYDPNLNAYVCLDKDAK